MTVPARFKQSDIARAIKGAKAAGCDEVRVELEPSGKIVILTGKLAGSEEPNPWDEDE